MAPQARDGGIRKPATIRALASPIRQELIDTLEALGGSATVAELAQQLGKPADGLYYHLRQLVKTGLLEAREDAGEGRRFRIVAPRGKRLRLVYQPKRSGQPELLDKVVGSLLGIARRDFKRALERKGTVLEGASRELWASRTKGWVNAAEVLELNQLLRRLTELLSQPRSAERDRLLALAFVLAPVAAQASRRGS